MRRLILVACALLPGVSSVAADDLMVFGEKQAMEVLKLTLVSSPSGEIPYTAEFRVIGGRTDGTCPVNIEYGDGVAGRSLRHTYTIPGAYRISASSRCAETKRDENLIEVTALPPAPTGLGFARTSLLDANNPAFTDGDFTQPVTTGQRSAFTSTQDRQVKSIAVHGVWPDGFASAMYPGVQLQNADGQAVNAHAECSNEHSGMTEVISCEIFPVAAIKNIVIETDAPFSITELHIN